MEYGQISTRAMAIKPKPRAFICFNGKVFLKFGIAETVCQTGLINRTAMVRDPYAWWCGRGEVVRPLPIPIGQFERVYVKLDFVPHLSYICKNLNGGKPWVNHPPSEPELNPN